MLKIVAAIVVFAALIGVQPSNELVVLDEGQGAIPNSHQYRLRSSADGREVLVQVSEPARSLDEGEKAAVVYGLDGNSTYRKLTDVARDLQISGEVAPAFVVSVGYPTDLPREWGEGRTRDYIHTPRQRGDRIDGGGGAAFQKFLIDDLRPFIEARYPIDSSRAVLWGHSLGGLFVAEVLATTPEAFNGYIVGSPSIWIDPVLLQRVRARAAAGAGEGRFVFVGVGGDEGRGMVPAAMDLAAALRAPGSRFQVRDRIFPGESHTTVQGAQMGDGLSYLLPSSSAPAAPMR